MSSKKTCKVVVVPHVRKGPRSTQRKSFEPTEQGWADALAHAQTGDATVYLVCDGTENQKTRIATCTEDNRKQTGALCRLDAKLPKPRKRR